MLSIIKRKYYYEYLIWKIQPHTLSFWHKFTIYHDHIYFGFIREKFAISYLKKMGFCNIRKNYLDDIFKGIDFYATKDNNEFKFQVKSWSFECQKEKDIFIIFINLKQKLIRII